MEVTEVVGGKVVVYCSSASGRYTIPFYFGRLAKDDSRFSGGFSVKSHQDGAAVDIIVGAPSAAARLQLPPPTKCVAVGIDTSASLPLP